MITNNQLGREIKKKYLGAGGGTSGGGCEGQSPLTEFIYVLEQTLFATILKKIQMEKKTKKCSQFIFIMSFRRLKKRNLFSAIFFSFPYNLLKRKQIRV